MSTVLSTPHSFRLQRLRSSLRSMWRVSLRHPGILAGGVLLLLVGALALFAPVLWTTDPAAIAPMQRLQRASAAHWFGTDMLGRDVYSRVIYGTRVSLIVGISVAILSGVIGTVIGLGAASSKILDGVLMRCMDGLMAIPGVLLAIALMAVAGASVLNVILAISVVEIPRIARTVRAAILTLREKPFIEAAIVAGASKPRIILRHYLPGCLDPLLVQATYVCAIAMVLEAVLSFIGAGTPSTVPSWGNLMAEAKAVWQLRPDLVFVPAAFLSATVLAVNLLGDGLRDALDPHVTDRA